MNHKITFSIHNQTPYYLVPNGHYTYQGDTNFSPETIKLYSDGSGGVIQASNSAFGGSAGGVIGYTIANPAVWIAMLGNDPNVSSDNNRARVAMFTTPLTTNGDLYNNMHDANVTVLTLPIAHGRIYLTSEIDQHNDTVAPFGLTFDRNAGVTDEALGVVVPAQFR